MQNNYIYKQVLNESFDEYRKKGNININISVNIMLLIKNKSAGTIYGTLVCWFHILAALSEINLSLVGGNTILYIPSTIKTQMTLTSLLLLR